MYDVITVGSSTVDVFAHTDYCEMVEVGKGREYIAYPLLYKKMGVDGIKTEIGRASCRERV